MKYKLVISDYDGTLGVAPDNNIDSETLEVIRKFTEKGGVFAVCSGRETSSIMRILKAHNIKGVVASFQGARITEIESGKCIFKGGLSASGALTALDAVAYSKLTPIAYGDSELYVQEKNPYVSVYENAVMLDGKVTDIREEVLRQGENVSKICWLGDDKIVNQVAEKLNAEFDGKGLKFNSGAKCLLEAINPEHGKGNAVKFIADYYGVKLEEVLTIGDSTNDIDLLVGPWHGVAVGDGREELKAVADEVTVPFSEKPVKTIIEKYCL